MRIWSKPFSSDAATPSHRCLFTHGGAPSWCKYIHIASSDSYIWLKWKFRWAPAGMLSIEVPPCHLSALDGSVVAQRHWLKWMRAWWKLNPEPLTSLLAAYIKRQLRVQRRRVCDNILLQFFPARSRGSADKLRRKNQSIWYKYFTPWKHSFKSSFSRGGTYNKWATATRQKSLSPNRRRWHPRGEGWVCHRWH